MKKTFLSLALIAAMLLSGCGAQSGNNAAEEKPVVESDRLYVKKVENLPDDFIMGMDVSSVISLEQSGVKFYDFSGEETDLFAILAANGVNYIRVRVWNNPYDENGNGFGGGNCDINTAVEIGRRATVCGMKLLVNFHYSDFWADPGKQMVPREWAGMEIEQKTEAVYEYTKDCLIKLRDAGVDVGMVQVGNETNASMCGETRWFNIQYLMQAGAKATREVFPEALVALHFANPETEGRYAEYAKKLAYYAVDYDVFASSYYPYWHGSLENLAAVLSDIADTYGKKVMVAETSYAYTAEDSDFSGNTIGEGSAVVKNYPYTVQGQANCLRDVVDTLVNSTHNAIGVFWWEGAWISVGTNSWEENHEIWEKYGSGWASSYARVYDPNDAGKYYGGSAVDNQAFFDPQGKPLESIKVFALMRGGNEITPQPDAVEDSYVTCDINGTIVLPETVNAVMTDDSRSAVNVEWNVNDEMLAQMYAGGAAKYDITGTAAGYEAHCYLNMIEFNFLENDSFETGDLTGWTVNDIGGADELYVENKKTDSLSGSNHMHFWSARQGSIEFTLEQRVEGLESGKYKYSVSIMGGDGGSTEIYAYVKIDGEIVYTAPMQITYYNYWDTAIIEGIEYSEGGELTVGIYVKCSGEGSGAWGKIDDAMLNSMA